MPRGELFGEGFRCCVRSSLWLVGGAGRAGGKAPAPRCEELTRGEPSTLPPLPAPPDGTFMAGTLMAGFVPPGGGVVAVMRACCSSARDLGERRGGPIARVVAKSGGLPKGSMCFLGPTFASSRIPDPSLSSSSCFEYSSCSWGSRRFRSKILGAAWETTGHPAEGGSEAGAGMGAVESPDSSAVASGRYPCILGVAGGPPGELGRLEWLYRCVRTGDMVGDSVSPGSVAQLSSTATAAATSRSSTVEALPALAGRGDRRTSRGDSRESELAAVNTMLEATESALCRRLPEDPGDARRGLMTVPGDRGDRGVAQEGNEGTEDSSPTCEASADAPEHPQGMMPLLREASSVLVASRPAEEFGE